MPGKARRVKSDALYHFVKTLDAGQYSMLHAYKAHHGKDSKEWQLIAYYRNLSFWSREQEQVDWAHEKLASIKYYAYRWLKKAMIRIGDFNTQALYDYKGIAEQAIHRGEYEEAAEDAREGYMLAMEREEFNLAEDLLHIERQAFAGFLSNEEMALQIKENSVELNLVAYQSTLLRQATRVRFELFEPLKLQYQADRRNDLEGFQALREALSDVSAPHWQSHKALTEYHHMRFWLCWVDKSLVQSLEHARVLRRMFHDHPWIMDLDFHRNLAALVSVATHEAVNGDKQAAIDIINEISERMDGNSAPFQVGAEIVAKGNFLVGRILNSEFLLARGRLLLEANDELILKRSTPMQFAFLNYWAALAAINKSDFRAVRNFCYRIFPFKSRLEPRIYARVRILYFLAIVAHRELDQIASESRAARKCIERLPVKEVQLAQILTLIDRCLKADAGQDGQLTDSTKFKWQSIVNENPKIIDDFNGVDWTSLLLQAIGSR